MKTTRVVLDLETCSTLNLPAVGAAAYFEHSDTQVTVAAYAIDRGQVQVWYPGDPAPVFPDDAVFVAHNYLFEFHAWETVLGPKHGWGPVPEQNRWSCTMARALYHALPASLTQLCEALHLAIKKDDSRKLMLQLARPRTTEPLTWWHETDPEKFFQLVLYCIQDVAAERLVDQVLPELSQTEQQVFAVDGRINRRGLKMDLFLVYRMMILAEDEMAVLDEHMRRLTTQRVRSCAQVGMLQTWLAIDQQCHVPDLRKHSVAEALAAVPHAPPKARAALLTRQEAARASTKKLNAMLVGRSKPGDRVKGLFQYGGAGRTLRWAGRRVQPQNFPRGTVKRVDAALKAIAQIGVKPDDLSALFEDSCMGVLASCLRSCFVADPGNLFAVADLAQIEARVVAWLAGQQDILDVFASGEDVYTYTARQQGSDNRQFGKVLVLACGFGMGPEKFQATAQTYGVALDLQQAIDAVWDWRQANSDIQQFWWDVGNAAVEIAGGYDGKTIWAGRVKLRRSRKAMRITLPSGRDLIYHNVGLERDAKGRAQIVFMGVDPKTKQWSRQRTYGGKLVENITQATARDVMAAHMIKLDATGVWLVGTVHDEVLAEAYAPAAPVVLEVMLNTMRTTPAWAPGLPLAAEGWVGERYRKG